MLPRGPHRAARVTRVRRSHRLLNRAVHAALRWVDRAGEVVPGTALADRFGSFGEGSCIDFPPATLLNVSSIHVGRDVLVGRQATLAAGYGVGDPGVPDRALVIGDGCVLGARITITAHQYVELRTLVRLELRPRVHATSRCGRGTSNNFTGGCCGAAARSTGIATL